MKREYVKPTMSAETFTSNEYVAACWKIKCNVPYGYSFIDANGNGKRDSNEPKRASGTGCGTWHKGVQGDHGPEANAMWQPTNSWGSDKGSAYAVYEFLTGTGNNDHHYSKVSDAEWETNPNAS